MNIWVQIAIIVVSAVVSYVNRPKPVRAPRPAFDEFDFPQYEDGTPQAVVFGDVWTDSWMVLGVGNYRTSPIKTDGGK